MAVSQTAISHPRAASPKLLAGRSAHPGQAAWGAPDYAARGGRSAGVCLKQASETCRLRLVRSAQPLRLKLLKRRGGVSYDRHRPVSTPHDLRWLAQLSFHSRLRGGTGGPLDQKLSISHEGKMLAVSREVPATKDPRPRGICRRLPLFALPQRGHTRTTSARARSD
jgi:hypothetical protein